MTLVVCLTRAQAALKLDSETLVPQAILFTVGLQTSRSNLSSQ